MIRFAWIRFRTQALVGAGVLAIVGAVLLVTGIQLDHAYDAAVAVCVQQGNCAHMFTYTFPSQGYLDAGNELSALILAVPALIGMFWGAPLAAREFETGTFRLAWTQGVTRTRWLAAKLAIAGAAAIAAAELFSLMVTLVVQPHSQGEPELYRVRVRQLPHGRRAGRVRGVRVRPRGHRRAPHPPHPARDGRHPRRLRRRHHRLPRLGTAPPHPARPEHLDAQPGIDRQYARSGSLQRASVPGTRGGGRPRPAPGSFPPASSPPRRATPPPASQPGPAPVQRASRALRRPPRHRPRPGRATTTSRAFTSGRR